MRVLELFAGIGACSTALTRLGIEHEIVDAVEIDKYAIASFNAIHGTHFEPQDITTWDKELTDIDLIMHGSPCQDFSIAGKQAGGDENSGTRSSLMYETIRIVGKIKPKYVIWENVKNILSQKHRHNFEKYLVQMQELGYNNYYQVLNAKDYGIPQNRERVFTISIRQDVDNHTFKFPEKQELKLRLKDMLEDNVDEKYYLSNVGVMYFDKQAKERGEDLSSYNEGRMITVAHGQNKGGNKPLDISPTLDTHFSNCWRGVITEPKCEQVGELDIKGQDSIKRVYSDEGLSPTLTDMQGGNRQPKIVETYSPYVNKKYNKFIQENGYVSEMFNPYNGKELKDIAPTLTAQGDSITKSGTVLLIKNATKQGYQEAYEGDSVNLAYPESETRRGRVGNQVAQTLQCNDSMGVVTAVVEEINKNAKHQQDLVQSEDGICRTIPAGTHGSTPHLLKTVVTAEELEHQELIEDEIRDNINDMLWRRGLQKEEKGQLRIRKLTPKEYWRLMGFHDDEFERAAQVNSNTQLYKQARKLYRCKCIRRDI